MTTDDPYSYWQHTHALPPLAQDSLPATTAVAVIGGGIVGAATAYWLARAGVKCALIERGALAAGATGRNGGLLVVGTAEAYPAAIARHGHATAQALWAFTRRSQALLREVLAEEQLDTGYRETGHLSLAIGAEQYAALQATAAALHADSFPADLLDRADTQALIHTPLADAIAGGLLMPESGVIHSARLVRELARAAQRRGARVVEQTSVTAIRESGAGLRIETTRGSVAAGRAVLALNAWAADLLPDLDGTITAVRGQALAYAPTGRVFTTGVSAHLTPTGEYWQQTADGTIVLGGCRAAADGMDIGVRALTPTQQVQQALETVIPRLFPALALPPVARRWAGPMAFTNDYLPIVDRAPNLAGALVVGGFSGHGMPFGMLLGRLLARAIVDDTIPLELRPFRLDRPTLHRA